MSIVKAFLGVVAVFFLVSVALIVPAIVTGSLLRLVFSSVDRGMSILIGLVATVSAVFLIVKFSIDLRPGPYNVGNHPLDDDDDDNEEDDEDDEDEDQDDESSRAPHRPPTWTLPTPERPSWKRRRRRR